MILAILDPPEGPSGPYSFLKDSSHLLLLELSRRGHRIFYTTPDDLTEASPVSVLEKAPYFVFQKKASIPLEEFSLILMRKDPPVDAAYRKAAEQLCRVAPKVPVLNNPEALLRWNEKRVILEFPEWIPRTLVSEDPDQIKAFVDSLGGEAVVKSLDSFGGKGVRRFRPDESICELVMVQEFLPSIQTEGEKRVFFLEGEPRGALLKLPPPEGFITNPDTGGKIRPTTLTPKEQELCGKLSAFLKTNGIFFAGVDLIGEKLTEINLTSPGLLWEWNAVDGTRHEVEIVDRMERLLHDRS